jgi:hypothetical protein
MTIDRLLITCSLIELTFTAYHGGPGCLSCFQWAAIALLCAKGVATLAERRHPRPSAAPKLAEEIGSPIANTEKNGV